MSGINNEELLRVRLGISQQEFADYLDVTRSQLAMHEQGSRSLPTEAILKIAGMESTHHALQQSKNKKVKAVVLHPDIQKHHDGIKKKVKLHLENCHFKMKVIQRTLDKMDKEYNKAEKWFQLLEKMIEEIPNDKKKKKDLVWLEKQKSQAIKKMIRHGNASQAKMQAAVNALSAEADFYKTLHEKL